MPVSPGGVLVVETVTMRVTAILVACVGLKSSVAVIVSVRLAVLTTDPDGGVKRSDFLRGPDGKIAWLRDGGRLFAKKG